MKVAVLLAGHHYQITKVIGKGLREKNIRISSRNGTHFDTGNLHDKIPHDADIYLSTHPSPVLPEYINRFHSVVGTVVVPDDVSQRGTIAAGLRQIDPEKYDVIVVTRPDLWVECDWPEINETDVTFLHWELADGVREMWFKKKTIRGVADIFWSFPTKYHSKIMKHLEKTSPEEMQPQYLHHLPVQLPDLPYNAYYDEFAPSGTKYMIIIRLKAVSILQWS